MIARNRYRNTVNNFLGADWVWQDTDDRSARLFYVLPMMIQPSDSSSQLGNDVELDHAARGTRLIGAYYQLPPLAGKTVIETYLLQQLRQKRPALLKLVALVDRPSLRTVDLEAHLCAFEADHRGVYVGYGLELTGKHANLPYIGRI